jgi:MFS family permease
MINSFGVFQSYYIEKLQRSPSDISWVGSIEIFLVFSIGVLSGRLSDAGFFRPLFLLGSILAVLGTMMASLCTQYWQTFLAQGICVGIGNGLMFCPTIAVVSTYFLKKRALAIGIGACGSGTGGIIYPLMVRYLLPQVGFGWSLKAIGFIQAGTLAIAALCLKPRVPPRKTGNLVDWSAFKELEYTLYAVGAFMVSRRAHSARMLVR